MTAMTSQPKQMSILLIEDNPGDIRLAREAFEEVDANVTLHAVEDGGRALALLRGDGESTERLRPNLILLDLNLPTKDGFEVLSEIKSDESLRQIPVIVLTTSDDEDDIAELYDKHANAFVTKPNDVVDFIDMIGAVESFWLSNATLPSRRVQK